MGLVLFLAADPLLLRPDRYGLLGIVLGAIGLLVYLTEQTVQASLLRFGALTLLVLLTGAVLSGYPWNAVEYSLVVGTAFLALAVHRGGSSTSSVRMLSGFFVLVGTFFLVWVGLLYLEQIQLFGRYGFFRLPSGPFRNPNVAGRFFGLVALVVGVSRLPSWIRYPGTILFVIPVLLSGSRGALLALLAASGYILWRRFDLKASGRLLRWGSVLVLLVVLGLLVGRPDYVTNLQRLKLIVESLTMAAEQPWFGVGGWNFGLVYPSVSLDGYWQRHAHSLPFQVLAEFGLVGFSLLVGGVLFFLNSRSRTRWIPVLVFLLVHEAVDTMIWIPGMLLLGLFALRPFARPCRTRPRSKLLLVVASLVMGLGALVWTVDRNHRRFLRESTETPVASEPFLSGVTGFGAMNRFVDQYRRSGAVDEPLLAEALRFNDYDPYYDWVAGRILLQSGRESLGRRLLQRYASKDPRGMLGLSGEGEGEPPPSLHPANRTDYDQPSLYDVIGDPTHPARYFPVVARSIRRGRKDRALRQIRHLMTYPRLTPELKRELNALKKPLEAETTRLDRTESDEVSERGRRRRQQFHQFFYRRPGRDYVTFR